MRNLVYETGPKRTIVALLIWTVGCMAGAFVAHQADLESLLCSASFCRSSITAMIPILSVPLVLSYIICRFLCFYLILPLVFLKGFTFAYSCSGVAAAFGNAAWLVRCIVLFSDSLCVCFLLWFWIRRAMSSRNIHSEFCFCMVVILLIGAIDFFCIAPIGEIVLSS